MKGEWAGGMSWRVGVGGGKNGGECGREGGEQGGEGGEQLEVLAEQVGTQSLLR